MKSRIKNLARTGDANFLEIIKHAFWAMILLIGTTLVQFVFDILLTRNYLANGAGIFYLCLTVIMVLSLAGRLGLDQAVIRYIPPLLRKNPGKVAGVKKSATILSLSLTLPLAILLYILAPYLAKDVFHSPELAYYLRIFAFGIPPLAMNYIYSGILRSMKKTQSALSIERLTMYLLGILGIATIGQVWGLRGAALGFILSIYVSTAAGLYYISRSQPSYKKVVPFSKKKLLITSGPLLFVAFANQLTGLASVLILGKYGSNAEVGIFNIALKISMLMNLVLASINVIAASKFSELYASKRMKELSITISKISALGTALGVPLFLAITLFPNLLLGLFGGEFKSGASTLIILAAGQLVNVSVGSTNYVLAMTGHERALAAAVGTSLVVNITLGLVLIPVYGVLGAGITTAVTLSVSNIIMVFMVKYYLDTWQLPFKYLSVWLSGSKSAKIRS